MWIVCSRRWAEAYLLRQTPGQCEKFLIWRISYACVAVLWSLWIFVTMVCRWCMLKWHIIDDQENLAMCQLWCLMPTRKIEQIVLLAQGGYAKDLSREHSKSWPHSSKASQVWCDASNGSFWWENGSSVYGILQWSLIHFNMFDLFDLLQCWKRCRTRLCSLRVWNASCSMRSGLSFGGYMW